MVLQSKSLWHCRDQHRKFGFHFVLISIGDRNNEEELLFELQWDEVSDLTVLRAVGIAV